MASVHKLPKAEIGTAVAQYVNELSTAAIAANGIFTIALSGGSMPKMLGEGLPSLVSKGHIFYFIRMSYIILNGRTWIGASGTYSFQMNDVCP
jgi:hypothetical protein